MFHEGEGFPRGLGCFNNVLNVSALISEGAMD